MDVKLAELILEDFNKSVDVKDTIWYDDFITLYAKILHTIDAYNKAKEEGDVFEYKTEYNTADSV